MEFLKKHKNSFIALLLLSLLLGTALGAVGAAFYHSLHAAVEFRERFPHIVFLLPLGGVLTVFIYSAKSLKSQGIGGVLSAARQSAPVSPLLFPAVFLGTVITQLFGGSAGKEGAALQIGGSIASNAARRLSLSKEHSKILTTSGLAALFSSVFATPLTALFFALEIAYINKKHYFKSFLPSALSSVSAFFTATLLGVEQSRFDIGVLPSLSLKSIAALLLVLLICIVACIIFCCSLELFEKLFSRLFKNAYLKIVVGAVLIVLLTLSVKSSDYNGGGMHIVSYVLDGGKAVWFAFLLKILFTSITNAAGFKGGEIVPALFIGATLGAAASALLSLPTVFCAAVGMIAVFCGATKCPLASVMLSIEFFGISALPYFLVAAVISRLLTFKFGLYTKHK